MTGPEQHADTVRVLVAEVNAALGLYRSILLSGERQSAQSIAVHDKAQENLASLLTLAERADTLERERDEAMRQSERAIELLQTATVGWREEMDAKDRLREALRRAEALAAEWMQDARGGTMEEALAEIRARLSAGEGTPA